MENEPQKGDVVFVVDRGVGVKRCTVTRVYKSAILINGLKYEKTLSNGKYYARKNDGEFGKFAQLTERAYINEQAASTFYIHRYWLRQRVSLVEKIRACTDIAKLKQIHKILCSTTDTQGESNEHNT